MVYQSRTCTTEAAGSTTWKYATASTMVVTLSLVITDCEAMGLAMIWRLTLTILSRTGTTKNTPGPFAPTQRPSRKITPRSYSWTIFTAFAMKIAMTARTTTPTIRTTGVPLVFMGAPSGRGEGVAGGGSGGGAAVAALSPREVTSG